MTEKMENLECFHDIYDNNHVLSKCDDVILEAKRVSLNEELDKIANVTLSTINRSKKTIQKISEQCKDSLDWRNESFWQDLPHPKDKPNNGNLEFIPSDLQDEYQAVEIIINDLIQINTQKIKFQGKSTTCELTKKYFHMWKDAVNIKKTKTKLIEDKIEHKEKLDGFIKKLKKWKKDEKSKTKLQPNDVLKPQKPCSSYKNRFNAQKSIIHIQRAKLEEQNKIIEELRLGIIREDLMKSIENTKISIREIFSGCSEKLKCKVPLVLIEEHNNFSVSAQKAPKIMQHMEQRALERARNREIILARKRFIEETRQRLLEEAIEKKRVLEEEDRKQNLELIKERRKRELELEKIRQANKQRYLDNLNKAIQFHNGLLLRQCFAKLYNHLAKRRENTRIAKHHYRRKTLRKYLDIWLGYIESLYTIKYEVADAHFEYKILKKTLKIWHKEHIEHVRNMQVAEDLYDFRLISNTFINWHRYVCAQIILEYKNKKIAEKHYNRRIQFHYFYQWRSLKAVLELEKAKDLKKRKWREKVWEILPDYRPPEDL